MEEDAGWKVGTGLGTGIPENKGNDSDIQKRNRSTVILVIILENLYIEYPKLDKYGAKT